MIHPYFVLPHHPINMHGAYVSGVKHTNEWEYTYTNKNTYTTHQQSIKSY